MADKPHLKLNSAQQLESSIEMKFNYGFPEEEEKDKKTKDTDYEFKIVPFRGYLSRINSEIQRRRSERNLLLQVPSHINYVKISFVGQFNIEKYYSGWINDFGLLGVNFSKFNKEGLFAVADEERLHNFLENINNFIIKESGVNTSIEYNRKILYVDEFELLTTEDIINYQEVGSLMNFQLVNYPIESPEGNLILNHLYGFLESNQIIYSLNSDSNVLEIERASSEIIEEIVRNFDIILNVTSSISPVIGPSSFNIPERSYGFVVSNPNDDLPIIGIIDTGISNSTPLGPIIIDDDSFNLTDSSPFIDTANDGYGHGTAVGALAALGRKAYQANYRGDIAADAKLLSMKVFEGDNDYLSQIKVLSLLKRAKSKYPEIKIFVLTICFKENKLTNQDISTYAFELDRFSHENDCLIFISTGNNNEAANQANYDLSYFLNEETNICSPAESMNNIIIGAAAGNMKDGVFKGISNGMEFPTLYTRKGNIELIPTYPKTKQNKNLFKPDVIEFGGDYEVYGSFIVQGEEASIEVLSSNPAEGYYSHIGTSFSTPLVSNIAAQILKLYPSLKSQTIKALIINAASSDKIPFEDQFSKLRNRLVGHGLVNPSRSLLSNDNHINFVIEDEISPGELKVMPINLPRYLTEDDLGKRRGLLKVSLTLCFSFDPVFNNHLGYCPIHMAFSIFRNHTAHQIIQKEDEIKSKLKSAISWSQNNRYKQRPIPASNSQKLQFMINVNELLDEDSIFKLAVHCFLSPQILSIDKYQISHPFSMAISIEENLPESRQTGRLYSELIEINNLESISEIEIDANELGDLELE
ncbi:MAG: S8 family peptidase [Bacteroidia bacterium]|nr:S8 family peptidase [Bacteroidia bacterium]